MSSSSALSRIFTRRASSLALLAPVVGVLFACGGGSSTPEAPKYAIGGVVKGLAAGKSMVLQSSWGESLTVQADGPFTFATSLPGATAYSVNVKTAPPELQCGLRNGVGSMPAASPVDSLSVRCTVPGALPEGDWAGATCYKRSDLPQPTYFTNAPAEVNSFRYWIRGFVSSVSTDSQNVSSISWGYSSATPEYTSADCSDSEQPTLGFIFSQSYFEGRAETLADLTVHWGSVMDRLNRVPRPVIVVRKDNLACIFNKSETEFPTAASLVPLVDSAIAAGQCYTPY